MADRTTQSGIPLQPFYTAADRSSGGDDEASREPQSDPGEYPYTRGRLASPRRRDSWISQELSGEGTARRSNEQFRQLIERGARGLDVIGDAPTMSAMDPDHPLARHAVGNTGVSICRLQDFEDLYADLPLDELTFSHSLPPGAFAVAAFHRVAKRRGFDPKALRGSTILLPAYCEDCSYQIHMPYDLRMRLALDSIEFAATEMPRFHAFLEDTYYISDGGLNAIEEMALGFVEIREIVRTLIDRGLDVDAFAPRIAILVNCRMDLFEEVAKIRATRRIFARMMREEFGAKDPRSWSCAITAHTSGLSMTMAQPVNNVARGAVQGLALALAGVQAVEISCFDEAYRTPSHDAHMVSLRTQQIVQLEAGADRVADPLGGSYFVESLTDELEQRILEMVGSIESMGPLKEVSEKGWFRRLFQEAMTRRADAIQDGSETQIGVNAFVIPREEDRLLRDQSESKIEPYWGRIDEIRHFKDGRDAGAVAEQFARMREVAAEGETNLIEPIADAFEAGLTQGEIAGALRLGVGEAYDPLGQMEPPA
ncbi:MAG: acyl-CoA mutase large subunit family protein [Deltaproteobacteria bacterium]|nr:acyl-CoA mutase large subunit family protein [Deltaproteobacteria bacterium]